MVSPLSLRSPDDIPPAFVPYPRPHPSIDDRATSDLFRQRDNAIREHRITTGRQRHAYPQREPLQQRQPPQQREPRQPTRQRIPVRLARSPYPRQKASDAANLEDWDDVAEENDGKGIPEEDNAAPARSRAVDTALNEVKKQYRKDAARGQTAVEDGSPIKNPFDDPKPEQHAEDPFVDDQGNGKRLESVDTATDSDFGHALESCTTRNPFADPEEHDPASAPASGSSVISSWKSSDRIQDYGSPNRSEDDGVIIEARPTAKLLRDSAACDCENVL